jgi:hypothetical protein
MAMRTSPPVARSRRNARLPTKAEPPAMEESPSVPVSFIAEDRDDHEEGVDAVAGCEFLDDRIRVLE